MDGLVFRSSSLFVCVFVCFFFGRASRIFGSQMFDSELKITTSTSAMCHRLFFPSIMGGQRRDIWMVSAQEVLSFHKVCKKFKVQDTSKEYSSLRYLLVGGCVRLRAVIPLLAHTDYSVCAVWIHMSWMCTENGRSIFLLFSAGMPLCMSLLFFFRPQTLMPHSTILNNHPVGQIVHQFVSGAESRASVQAFVRSQFKAPEEKTPPMIDAASLDDVKGNVSLFEVS